MDLISVLAFSHAHSYSHHIFRQNVTVHWPEATSAIANWWGEVVFAFSNMRRLANR